MHNIYVHPYAVVPFFFLNRTNDLICDLRLHIQVKREIQDYSRVSDNNFKFYICGFNIRV